MHIDHLKCPVCAGTDLSGDRPIFDRVGIVNLGSCYRHMECENCGATWMTVFPRGWDAHIEPKK